MCSTAKKLLVFLDIFKLGVQVDDAMIVAIIAPPDDKIKRMKVIEWVQSEPARYRRVRSEVLAKGLQISLNEMET